MQTTNTLVMVRPASFAFNIETAVDNEFQQQTQHSAEKLRELALKEFTSAVEKIAAVGIEVLVLEENPTLGALPDAVFPNNWFATDRKGNLYIFPMLTKSRAKEVRIEDLKRLLSTKNHVVESVIDLRKFLRPQALEGTGSLVFDHAHRKAYMAESARSNIDLAFSCVDRMGYQLVHFQTRSSRGLPFYHTNVVMSVGKGWAAVCSAAIHDPIQREQVLYSLRKDGLEVIDLSVTQTEDHFCANVLQVDSKNDSDSYLLMSTTAYSGFSSEQIAILSRFASPLAIDIPTIEHVGGGSLRCMIAEIFF